jgi:hypothetical protein
MDIVQLRGDLFIGGLLTVSDLGIPTEFMHSEQIRPTALQISLYGSTLGKYLLLDVVGKGLAEASQHRSLPLVVASRELLPLADRVRRPVCYLSRTSDRPLADVGDMEQLSDTQMQVQLSDTRSPVLFEIYSRDNFAEAKSLPVFRDCSRNFDITEPMQRVRRTLESLQRETAGSRG